MTEAEAESVLTRGPLVGIPEADCLSRTALDATALDVSVMIFDFPSVSEGSGGDEHAAAAAVLGENVPVSRRIGSAGRTPSKWGRSSSFSSASKTGSAMRRVFQNVVSAAKAASTITSRGFQNSHASGDAAATGGGVTAEAAAAAVSSPTTPCPATPRTRPAQQLASRRRSPPPPSRRKGSRTRLSEQPFSPADFSRLRQVGRGGFGVVYLVVKRDEPNKGAPFAMKVLEKGTLLKAGTRAQARLERDVLRVIRHTFVVRLRYAFQTETRLYLLTDFYAGGALSSAARAEGANGRIPADAARFYVAELTLALEYIHAAGIVHRDVKPANVLVDRWGHVALCDFGIAAIYAEGRESSTPSLSARKSFCGTVEYMAPELLRGENYNHSVDWWALGALFYELVAGRTPFRAPKPRDLFQNILHAKPDLERHFEDCPEVRNVVARLLNKDADARLGSDGAERVKRTQLFDGLDWEALLRREIQPPQAPVLPAYFVFGEDGRLSCLEKGSLPKLDADDESDDSGDERVEQRRARKAQGVRPSADAFKGFSFAGETVQQHPQEKTPNAKAAS